MRRLQKLVLSLGLGLLIATPSTSHALNDVYVVQFILDGVQAQVLEQAVAQGELPNLKKFFLDQGAVFEKALTTYPTVSSPGYASFATGLSAGNSGIVFLEWFDRTKQRVVGYLTPEGHQRVNQDLINLLRLQNADEPNLYSPTTLFEKLSPQPTAAIYSPLRQGATIIRPKTFPVRALFSGLVAKDGLALNRLAMRELNKTFAKPLPKIPRYTLVGLYGTDFYGHQAGPESEEVRLVLKQFDYLFGQFVEQLKAKGSATPGSATQAILEKTYLILTSDHGMHATGKQIKLKEYLWKKGIRRGDSIYVSNRGVSSTFIYAASPEGWEELPSLHELRHFPTKTGSVDLIQVLVKNKAIDWVAARDDFDRVRLYGAKGQGVIARLMIGHKRFYSYLYQGQDPLQFAEAPELQPLTDGKPYPADLWVEKTLQTRNPNAVVELSQLFSDPRAGDILVMAKGSYGFRKAKAGTHGSLTAQDMNIPLWIYGPGIPAGRWPQAKSTDVYPTVLNWFGLLEPSELKNQEGSVLFAQQTKEQSSEPQGSATQTWLARLEQELVALPPLSKLPDKDEVAERLKAMVPAGLKAELQKTCQTELELRYARWKKLDQLQEKAKKPDNPLAVPRPLRDNMEWLLANERNIEFIRLRRMEDLQSILENP